MNQPTTLKRRMAKAFLRHAETILPDERRSWLDAMRSEVSHITDDKRALQWAWGCLVAGYIERARTVWQLIVGVFRWAVVLSLLGASAYNAYLVVEHRAGWKGMVGIALYLLTAVLVAQRKQSALWTFAGWSTLSFCVSMYTLQTSPGFVVSPWSMGQKVIILLVSCALPCIPVWVSTLMRPQPAR